MQFLDHSSEKASCNSWEGVPAAAKPPTAEIILCRNQGNPKSCLVFPSSTIYQLVLVHSLAALSPSLLQLPFTSQSNQELWEVPAKPWWS